VVVADQEVAILGIHLHLIQDENHMALIRKAGDLVSGVEPLQAQLLDI